MFCGGGNALLAAGADAMREGQVVACAALSAALRAHRADEAVVEACCVACLRIGCCGSVSAQALSEAGVVESVLQAMQLAAYPNALARACDLLSLLAQVLPSGRRRIVLAGGARQILVALSTPALSVHEAMCSSLAACMLVLSADSRTRAISDEILQARGLEVLLATTRIHQQNVALLLDALGAVGHLFDARAVPREQMEPLMAYVLHLIHHVHPECAELKETAHRFAMSVPLAVAFEVGCPREWLHEKEVKLEKKRLR